MLEFARRPQQQPTHSGGIHSCASEHKDRLLAETLKYGIKTHLFELEQNFNRKQAADKNVGSVRKTHLKASYECKNADYFMEVSER